VKPAEVVAADRQAASGLDGQRPIMSVMFNWLSRFSPTKAENLLDRALARENNWPSIRNPVYRLPRRFDNGKEGKNQSQKGQSQVDAEQE
jgi:hypothetical protein